MPAIRPFAASGEAHVEAWRLHTGRRFGEAVVAQRLAESYCQEGEGISAVGVLTDAAAELTEGRFAGSAVALLQRIVKDQRDASSLKTVAESCLELGERKYLVAAVCLLGIAHEYDRTDSRALELLARAFVKMGLEEKARKVEAVLAEISEEEPTLPIASDRPLTRSDRGR
jgi:hypothetical protein